MSDQRRKVRKCVDHYLDMCGSLADIRDEVAELIEKHGEAAEVVLDVDEGIEDVSVSLWIEVDETDEQVRRRLEQEAYIEARERAELARLTAKFGGDGHKCGQ